MPVNIETAGRGWGRHSTIFAPGERGAYGENPETPHGSVETEALEIAVRFRLPTPYDGFYVAVAELLDCDLWTADSRLVNALGARIPRLHVLSTYRP